MKITKRQLKRIIREVAQGNELFEVIKKFSSGQGRMIWQYMTRQSFYDMAAGRDGDGARAEYYSHWADSDFIYVIEQIDGEYIPRD